MPVPVSVTHASGVGLGAEGAAELPTLGPFARLATSKNAAVTANGSIAANGDSGAPMTGEPPARATPADSRSEVAAPALDAGAAAVETSHLRFTYPGIGGCDRGPLSGNSLRDQVCIKIIWDSGTCTATRCTHIVALKTLHATGCLLPALQLSTQLILCLCPARRATAARLLARGPRHERQPAARHADAAHRRQWRRQDDIAQGKLNVGGSHLRCFGVCNFVPKFRLSTECRLSDVQRAASLGG